MMIDQQYTTDREKLQKIRLLMVGQVELMFFLRKLQEILHTQVFFSTAPYRQRGIVKSPSCSERLTRFPIEPS